MHKSLKDISDKDLIKYFNLYQAGIAKGKRFESEKIHKIDIKFAYHVVRLLDECEQILAEGDIDLQRNREQLKAIRRGDVTEEEIRSWVSSKEKQLGSLYASSKLQYGPDEDQIKRLLLNCLEHHYENLNNCIVIPDAARAALREIDVIIQKNRSLL